MPAKFDRDRRDERILIIDQSTIFAEALAKLLSSKGFTAGHACLADAATRARALRPSLCLVDADERRHHVLACVADVAVQAPASRILLLVGRRDEWADALAEQVGALGCVSRSEGSAALLHAIDRTRSGRLPRSGLPTGRRVRHAHSRHAGPLAPLTRRELEILQALAVGLRDPAIGRGLGISSHTVRTHVQNILAKLRVHTRHQAVTVALHAGLRPSLAWDRREPAS